MKKKDVKALINAVITLRDSATDEQAAAIPELFPTYKENREYKSGERIMYNGSLYKVTPDHDPKTKFTPDMDEKGFKRINR